MRILLDAHVSSRHVGRRLVAAGRDVLALDQDELLGRLADEEVLELAVEQGRIVLTHNVRDFAAIARRWGEARRTHAGLVLVTLPHVAFGAILSGIEQAFASLPTQEDWVERTEFLGRDE